MSAIEERRALDRAVAAWRKIAAGVPQSIRQPQVEGQIVTRPQSEEKPGGQT